MDYNKLYNPALKSRAQTLRKEMTKEERHLWYDFLKTCPVQFNRQKIIGNYIVDFYCDKAKLVVELDGSQHFSEEGIDRDRQRDDWLLKNGFLVLRYSNADVQRNFRGVCENILHQIKLRTEE